MLTKLMSFFKSAGETPQVDTHWFSESGIIDMFVMLGPSPRNVFRQYSQLTGPTMLPPVSDCRTLLNTSFVIYEFKVSKYSNS